MSRDIMQQALDAIYDLQGYLFDIEKAIAAIKQELAKPEQEFYPNWDMIKPFHKRIAELEEQLAKPEQVTVSFPSFIRKRIEEAIDLAINPKGMSVHDGKAIVYASDLQRMIAVIDLAPPRKEWVGLTGTEINHIFAANVGYPERMCYAIEAKLKEKNNAI
jgi:hypothetical protein